MTPPRRPPVALTIAGSDPTGGAGIQADLATFAAAGVHGTSVVTALTAQGPGGLSALHVPPLAVLLHQLDAVLGAFRVDAVKVGMAATTEIVLALGERAADGALPRLVVDPVLASGAGGQALLAPGALDALTSRLLPHALVATPNGPEAAALLGWAPHATTDRAGQRAAARALADRARAGGAPVGALVVVTGGHVGDGRGPIVDVVAEVHTSEVHELRSPRVATVNTHGTGCTFSAAVAAGLARGRSPLGAVGAACRTVHGALLRSQRRRHHPGWGPVDHTVP